MKTSIRNEYQTVICVFWVMYICFFGKSFAQTRITIDYKNTPGTSSLPYCYLQNVSAELWGGGGGGGGANAPNGTNRQGGGGGGGGGAYISNANFGNPTASISVHVGYGGTAGSGASGGAGNNPTNHSQITIGSLYATAKGGGGGGGANANLTGAYVNGTVGAGGTYESNIGASGQNGYPGGAGSTNTNPASWAARGGTGGSSPNGGSGGGGGEAKTATTQSNGSNGNPAGGGGGGAAVYCATALNGNKTASGGIGAAGNVKISFDFAIPNIAVNKSASNFCDGGSDVISINSTICSGSTYQWYKDGIAIPGATSSSLTVTEGGTYYVIATLTISDLKAALVSQGLPSSASVSPNSATASRQSGDCVITIKQATSSTINAAICAGQSYILNGQTYTSSGSFTQHLTNTQGCDSIITLNTTVHPAPEVEFLTMETCAEDGQIVLSFTGQPPFTMNYTFNADCVGTNLNPNLYGLPTVFGYGYPNILSWTNTGSNYLAGILPYFSGQLRFHILEIIDDIGCRSVRPE